MDKYIFTWQTSRGRLNIRVVLHLGKYGNIVMQPAKSNPRQVQHLGNLCVYHHEMTTGHG
jgi:hypothetical protein